MDKSPSIWLIALLISCILVGPLLAQESTSGDQARAAQYFLGRQDQLLMAVNVWGFVNKPGQYMVPYDTDLISLLSYAGGPREEAKIKSIRVIRPGKGDKPQVIDVDVKNFINTAEPKDIPVLKPGDTVVVSGSSFHFISKFFEFTTRIAVLIQAWALFEYYRKNK